MIEMLVHQAAPLFRGEPSEEAVHQAFGRWAATAESIDERRNACALSFEISFARDLELRVGRRVLAEGLLPEDRAAHERREHAPDERLLLHAVAARDLER